MSLRSVTWKEKMDEWHQNPDKLLAWLTKLFWDAQIPPEEDCIWVTKSGKIIIFGKIEEVKDE
jgi:hypothetical protein